MEVILLLMNTVTNEEKYPKLLVISKGCITLIRFLMR